MFEDAMSILVLSEEDGTSYRLMSNLATRHGRLDIVQFLNDRGYGNYRDCMMIAIETYQLDIMEWICDRIDLEDMRLKSADVSRSICYGVPLDETKRLSMLKWVWKNARNALNFQVACTLTTGSEALHYFVEQDMISYIDEYYPDDVVETLGKISIRIGYRAVNPRLIEICRDRCSLSAEKFVPYFLRAIKEGDRTTVEFLWSLCMSKYYEKPDSMTKLSNSMWGHQVFSTYPIPWLQELSDPIHETIGSVCHFCSKYSIYNLVNPKKPYNEACAELKKISLVERLSHDGESVTVASLLELLRDPFRTLEYVYHLFRLRVVCATSSFLNNQMFIHDVLTEDTLHIFKLFHYRTKHFCDRNPQRYYAPVLTQYFRLIVRYIEIRGRKLYCCIKWIHYNICYTVLEKTAFDFLPEEDSSMTAVHVEKIEKIITTAFRVYQDTKYMKKHTDRLQKLL